MVGAGTGAQGARVWAFVESSPGFSRGELVGWLAGRLAPYKIPSVIVEVAELPRSAAGKVLRAVLRQHAERAQP